VTNQAFRPPRVHKPLIGGLALRRMGPWRRLVLFLAVMGPGLITGIVDDDATGIAGYSVAGARFGYNLLWTMTLASIALGICGEMSARIGAVTGKGLGEVMRERFGVRITSFVLLLLLTDSIGTTIADVGGVAGGGEILGVSRYVAVPVVAVFVFGVVAYGTYFRVEKVLIAGSFIMVSYIIAGFLARPDWGAVATHSLMPRLQVNVAYLSIMVGLVGTTITPWQQSYLQSSVADKGLGDREVTLVRLDVLVGAIASAVIAFFIIITTAATLHAHGQPSGNVE